MSSRFVIHKHTQGKDTHWDLMIEQGDCLKTWRLENPPEKLASEKTKATPIFDHDKKFLTYQGTVNNGKGTVEIVDEGICTIELTSENRMNINFEGKILKGNFWLIISDSIHFIHSEGKK
ncbi:MAG: DNA polymerase ligase N-terminal domain-containing protein [Sedimentisphaerales bacterium]